MLLLCPVTSAAADFRVTPYLQNPAKDAITIMWFAQTNTEGQLRYWPQGGITSTVNSAATLASSLDYHSTETSKAHFLPYTLAWQHQVRLTNLTAGTTYRYIVTQDATTYTNRFKTAPAQNSPIRFIYYWRTEGQTICLPRRQN